MTRTLTLFLIVVASSVFAKTTYLFQKDFDQGTYIISEPGTYVLAENIAFNPNHDRPPYDAIQISANQLKSNGGKYDDEAYGLGFFAAIVIRTSDVTLDLNQNTIEQSQEHALLQRFFSIIELADQPFIPGQGPHNFGEQINPATRVLIKNGTIGRSSHHGMHGNGNRSVTIEGVKFKDFEVAAVALDGVDGLLIKNCSAESRKDVQVIGTFSAAQFILPYLDYLVESGSKTTLNVGSVNEITPREARDRLRQAILAVHEDLIKKEKATIDKEGHPEEYALFHNPEQVIDGNCYGFLINSYGQAIEGFPIYRQLLPAEVAKNITIQNTHVTHLKGKVNEIVAINHGNKAVTDPVGAVFQIHNEHPDTDEQISVRRDKEGNYIYKGNILSNAQALVAKAHLNGDYHYSKLDLSRSNMTQEVINWVEADYHTAKKNAPRLLFHQQDFLCNADSMFHVNKGVIGFKIDGAYKVLIDNTSVSGIANLSEVGLDTCGMYAKSHPKATLEGCGGPKTRGYSIAGSNSVRIANAEVSQLTALCGTAVGFDVMTDSSNVLLENCDVHTINAGEMYEHNHAPNEPPMAVGFRVSPSTHNVALMGVCASDMKGFSSTKIVLDESSRCRIHYNCPEDVTGFR